MALRTLAFATGLVLMMATMAPLASTQEEEKITPLTKHGMDLTNVAFDSVCWYEFYKSYPDGNKDMDVNCNGVAKDIQGQIEDKEEVAKVWYGKFMEQEPMSRLPPEYTSCRKYLADSSLKPESDESDALNDPNAKDDFAYKGFAYCLISALRNKYGEKAISAVKSELTHGKKDWREAAVDKENENRVRHGVAPLRRLKELDDGAQLWAEVIAKECNSRHHSPPDYPGKAYTGQYMEEYNSTGENLGGLEGYDEARMPYGAMRSWYQEVENYPFPMSFDDCTTCDTEVKPIGHFAQSVWASSKFVGYGLAFNPACLSAGQSFFVARYYPAGNVQGSWGANVFPAKY